MTIIETGLTEQSHTDAVVHASRRTELLKRRKQAIQFLLWLGVTFMLGGIVISVIQAFYYGYGLFLQDNVHYDRLPMPTGSASIWPSLLAIALTTVICSALIRLWTWVGDRVGDLSLLDEPQAQIDEGLKDEDFFVIHMPRVVTWLTRFAVLCIVVISASMVLLVPVVLIKFGWVWN